MDEKLKKLAIKVEGLLHTYSTPQATYYSIVDLAKSQKDYFTYLGPENLLKLTFYVYSFKKTNGFKLAEKIINNLTFIELIQTDNDKYLNDCPECRGDGVIRCDSCDGIGSFECQECGGDGEIYVGNGSNHECENCSGNGEISCQDCNGDGEINCDNCGGIGEIESDDEVFYTIYTVVTWNDNIKNICELRENTNEPIMSEDEFNELADTFIILHYFNEHGPLNISENEMYCIGMSDEPNLRFNSDMVIDWFYTHFNASHLFH